MHSIWQMLFTHYGKNVLSLCNIFSVLNECVSSLIKEKFTSLSYVGFKGTTFISTRKTGKQSFQLQVNNEKSLKGKIIMTDLFQIYNCTRM